MIGKIQIVLDRNCQDNNNTPNPANPSFGDFLPRGGYQGTAQSLAQALDALRGEFHKSIPKVFVVEQDKSAAFTALLGTNVEQSPTIFSSGKGRFVYDNPPKEVGFVGIILPSQMLDNELNFVQIGTDTYFLKQVFDFQFGSAAMEQYLFLLSKFPIHIGRNIIIF